MRKLIATVALGATALGGATVGPAAAAPVVAPYVDTSLTVPFPLFTTVRTSRARGVVLGFAVAQDRGTCTPVWGGADASGPGYLAADAQRLRAAGVRVIPSFGGAAGTELAAACPTAEALAQAYAQILVANGANEADFDIEGGVLGNAGATARRSQAIAMLQAAAAQSGRTLPIDFTLPVDPTGISPQAVALLRSAVSAGVKVRAVNLMVMDYGPDSVSHGVTMSSLAIRAANATHRQLAGVFPGTSAAQRFSMMALTPMIGVNDEPRQITTLADARRIAAFARARRMSRVSYWSISRDRACAGGARPRQAKNNCSGVRQARFAFLRALGG